MPKRGWKGLGILVLFGVLGIGVGYVLSVIVKRQAEAKQYPLRLVEIGELEVDPAVWGQNFPLHYDRFLRTREEYGRTAYGGGVRYDKLAEKPFLKLAWAGHPFSVDYKEDRGHHYAQLDQYQTKRTTEFKQPGACLNCHTGEFVKLVAEIGWDTLNRTPYNEFRERLAAGGHLGVTCADCHDPKTMALRITRPALENALKAQGKDWRQASRQEMRSLVCAQCHVEYYFLGEGKTLTFPWSRGTSVEAIEAHYDAYGFKDWTHAITQAPMIKMQHPEYELYTTSVHHQAGVACADCHMPYIRVGGMKISDHWIRSPLTQVAQSCQTCHRVPEAELLNRVKTIQDRTKELATTTEKALEDAILAIQKAMEAGVPDEALEEARKLHRAAQLRWDFVDAENSMGFHSPQEAARILLHATDLARQAQLAAERALAKR
ncbi:formate-dependent nitrite reductase, periplasmic cytochrome c552 subunit [Thermus oshimai JL-2]|jgi:nitrite reductase (cytochrome c-552)|uniref:nitrite reductase (cytochrome; ammonia-forming) n=1 Tax=Thermus oshimai JL-2 TaxID=751945 RepID=K7R2Y8_THEOS|nr:formate-dependent nitrite reductase, periplasmic cytochrome c552 subunit [Thermus oshimai JL-2]